MDCINETVKSKSPCQQKDCRYHIEYSKELNCCHISIMKNGSLKLQEVGDRLNITAARVKQIEEETLLKISKKKSLLKILSQ